MKPVTLAPDLRDPAHLLAEKSIRPTRVRSALLAVLRSGDHAASVPDLLSRLKRRGIRCNKTTVYRDLALFERTGLVRRTSFRDGTVRYEPVAAGHHHHLVCLGCARVEDIDLDAYEAELQRAGTQVYRHNGFRILDHMLELFGLCRACGARQAR